jgi:hypothetical protein
MQLNHSKVLNKTISNNPYNPKHLRNNQLSNNLQEQNQHLLTIIQ